MMKTLDVLQYVWTHPGNRNHRLRAVTRACMWQAQKRITGRPWTIECFDGMRMRCYPDSHGGSSMIYNGGTGDFDDIQFTRAYLSPGDAFLDIGANIGIYTLLAASRVGSGGKVLAFEAGSRAYRRLQENVELNGLRHVELRNAAVAESDGDVMFSKGRDLVNRIIVADPSTVDDAGLVPCVTLDTAVAGTHFEMGKIDIEGAEPMVFRGSIAALQEGNPSVWLMEMKDRLLTKYGFSASEFSKLLRDHDYQLGSFDADKNELSFSEQPWIGRENIIAVRSSAMDQTMERLARHD